MSSNVKKFTFSGKPKTTIDIAGHIFEIESLNAQMYKQLLSYSEQFTAMKDSDDTPETIKKFNSIAHEFIDYMLGEGASDKIFEDVEELGVWERLEVIKFLQEQFLEVTQKYQQKFDISRIKR